MPQGGVRRLLNNGLRRGKGVVSRSQRAWHIDVTTEVMQKRPIDDRGENGAVSCVKVHKAFAYACRVIGKEIEHRLVLTCRRREIQGLARYGRSWVKGVTKLADILKTPVEKHIGIRNTQ